jgi:metal-responsive CopG/Arc/MetJ family transcriptional regulator
MPRIYTEIRIAHETEEDKKAFEKELDKALKRVGFYSRVEWLRYKSREIIQEAKNLDRKPK